MVRPPLSPQERERGRLLGLALRDARGARSMVEVAAAAGVPVETLRKIESGRVPTPAFFTVAALADAAVTVVVGEPDPEDVRLVSTTRAALDAGIAAARPGNRIGDISAAIGAVAAAGGYGLNTDFGGHGIGRRMHEEPSVPNAGRPGRGRRMEPGLVIAIEPWFLAGGRNAYVIGEDGWTIRSAGGTRTAHQEHTVAITDTGPRVLTLRR